MTTLSADEVRKRALVRGSSMSWVDLLKSEAVANEVANRAWAYLASHGYGRRERRHVVQVRRSVTWEGTWLVRVLLPGVRLPDRMPGGKASNNAHTKAALEALQASYTPSDLVASWSNNDAPHWRKGGTR